MTKTTQWISAGVVSLVATIGSAGDAPSMAPIPTDNAAVSGIAGDCNPCPDVCDPCCPPAPRKWKKACAAPPKIIVHQTEPIVEFRNDAPKTVAAPCNRPVIEDRCVRPVGGEGPGCGCQHGGGFTKSKTKNYFQGVGGFGAAPQVMMTAMPVTVQAYVPQLVQTYSVAQAYGVAPAGFAYGAAAYPGYAPPSGYLAQNDATVRALADLIANAAANAPQQRAAGFAANAPAADANRLPALEAKVQEIDARLSSLERRIDALCKTK